MLYVVILFFYIFFFFFKQKTAYEMRISDWSSDVCSSDLSPFVGWYSGVQVPISGLNTQATCSTTAPGGTDAPLSPDGDCNAANEIGRASCRERVCQYV